MANQQLHTEAVFQPFDGRGDRRLGDVQLARGLGDAAALDGVNVPVNKMPLAWPGLNPGCAPNMASNCFKISSLSAINFSSFGSGIVSLLLRA